MPVFLAVISLCALTFSVARPGVASQSPYIGVSEDRPTGSDRISVRDLVLAFDMSTRTSDLLMRDFSPLGNHGEVLGTTTSSGVHGGSTLFRVASDRIDLPENASLAIDGPLAIALWLRVDALTIHQHILACDDKFALWVTPQNRVRFSDTLGHGVDSADPIAAGQWHSLVAVYSGSHGGVVTQETVRLYIDGMSVQTEVVNRSGDDPVRWTPGELYSGDACYVGFESHQGNAAHQNLQFEGAIDELLVFGRALSPDEVRAFASRP